MQFHTPLVNWSYCGRRFVCCSQVRLAWKTSLAWKTISCQTEKGNRVKHSQIWQGTDVEDGRCHDNSLSLTSRPGDLLGVPPGRYDSLNTEAVKAYLYL